METGELVDTGPRASTHLQVCLLGTLLTTHLWQQNPCFPNHPCAENVYYLILWLTLCVQLKLMTPISVQLFGSVKYCCVHLSRYSYALWCVWLPGSSSAPSGLPVLEYSLWFCCTVLLPSGAPEQNRQGHLNYLSSIAHHSGLSLIPPPTLFSRVRALLLNVL